MSESAHPEPLPGTPAGSPDELADRELLEKVDALLARHRTSGPRPAVPLLTEVVELNRPEPAADSAPTAPPADAAEPAIDPDALAARVIDALGPAVDAALDDLLAAALERALATALPAALERARAETTPALRERLDAELRGALRAALATPPAAADPTPPTDPD